MSVHSFKDQPATKLIASAQKGSKAPLQFLPPFIVHKDNNSYTDEANAIFHGQGLVPQMQD
jgi:tRNA1(Val) A37 N6-methylase TrmN6